MADRKSTSKNRSERFPGIHVEAVVSEADGDRVLNDSLVEVERLGEGLRVMFDEPIGREWAKPPVLRLTIDVPWPLDLAGPGEDFVGTQAITLDGDIEADDGGIVWRPDDAILTFLQRLVRLSANYFKRPILARLTVMGNAVASEDGERFLNGRAFGRLDDGRIDLALPTVDDVHGADFRTWFWITRLREAAQPRIEAGPSKLVFVEDGEELSASIQNVGDADLDYEIRAVTTSPPGGPVYEISNTSGTLSPGGTQLLLVRSRAAERGIVYAGQLVIRSNDPDQGEVTISLSSSVSPGIIVVPDSPFRLKPLRKEVMEILTAPPEEPVDPRRLRAELETRDQPLRLAVAPGSEDIFASMRDRLTASGIEVERVEGDPIELAGRAESGEIVLDGIVGDVALANELAEARR